ncbi:MAG: PaaI family thioesterase [Chloroflexota bacterium]
MTAQLAATEEEIRRVLHSAAFVENYGFTLHSIGDGEATLNVPFRANFERPGGIVSGPVFMAAADVAMWLAILTKLGATDQSVTVEMSTAFLSKAQEEDFLCTATVLKLGRRLVYGVAECVSLTGKRLTHHTLTYVRPST